LIQPSDRVPQREELAARAGAMLREHLPEVRDYTAAFHERWAARGITTLQDGGFAVLPLFIPAQRLHFVGAAFHAAMTRLRTFILTTAQNDSRQLMDALPFGKGIAERVDIVGGALSPAFMAYLRPDGFLFEDRYVLSEINYGNGIIVSTAYTELLADYWENHPVLRSMGVDVALAHPRPFQRYLDTARRFARPVERPAVALLVHSDELKEIHQFPPRVMHQIRLAIDLFAKRGMEARLVTEAMLGFDRSGAPCFEQDGAPVDLVMLVAVGTTFLDDPAALAEGGRLRPLGRARWGDVWVLKPLAGLLMDKGALPLLTRLGCRQFMPDGFHFDVSQTEHPFQAPPDLYATTRPDWVIKRAFDGKDTHPGIARDPSTWIRVVSRAVADQGYVAQRYVSMPRARIPVLLDGKHLEWIESRVELSSFMFDGANGGSGVRYAPDAEGLVMTDFPAGYGYTTALAM
jgi:hypothetical protein